MLIDGQKWACEACIRGHRVTSCKHHDRPLIRIKGKGRPFATCSICHTTPCSAPTEHARAKREAELKSHSKKASHARLYPRHHNPNGFLPIAPRPSSGNGKDASGSSSASASVSSSHTPVGGDYASRRDSTGAENWSGSEGSGDELGGRAQPSCILGVPDSGQTGQAGSGQPSRSPPDTLALDPVLSGNIFDPAYSLLPSSTVSDVQLAQTVPLISPLEGGNPFDFRLEPELTLDDGTLDAAVTEGLPEDVFHVENWSRYMWSPETGFEHLDMGYPPVTR